MFCITLGLGLKMTIGNELSLYSKLKAMVTRHTDMKTSLKTQQAVYNMSHLCPSQRLITYPAVTTVDVLDTSSTEAEAELLLYFSRSAWSSAFDEGTTAGPVEDQIALSLLEQQYLLLTEEDSPYYEIWNDMLRSCPQISGVQVSTLNDAIEKDYHPIDPVTDSYAHDRVISGSVTSQWSRGESGRSASWSSSSSGSCYSEKPTYPTDSISAFLEFSFDPLVLKDHEPLDLLDWIRRSDDSFEALGRLEYLQS